MREAFSLSRENTEVQAAFEKLKADDAVHPLLKFCQDFVNGESEDAGKKAVQYLSGAAHLPADAAKECLELVVYAAPKAGPVNRGEKRTLRRVDAAIQDSIVSGIIRESKAVKLSLAKQLVEKPTETFQRYYAIGDGTANSLAGLVLETDPWSSETQREKIQTDVFMLFLAKLLEVGNDYDGRALKGISRLMAADAGELAKHIDDILFDAILSSLDIRLPIEVRTQATLTAAKFLETCPDDGQQYLAHYIQLRLERQTGMALTRAFSAAAALFPLVSSMASPLFLVEGFVPSLVPILGKMTGRSNVEQAALEMISAACIDSACRQAIQKYLSDWLQQVMNNAVDEKKGLAGVILAKIQGPSSNTVNGVPNATPSELTHINDLLPKLQGMMLSSNDKERNFGIEGLAYASSRPEVKEIIAKDIKLLDQLFSTMKATTQSATVVFGALNILSNLTSYPPTLSEEQKKMSQLKAYASASKPSEPHPAHLVSAVTARCRALVAADAVSAIVNLPRSSLSPTSLSLTFSILLSLAQTQSLRGTIAQQGGAKFLLQSYPLITGQTPSDYRARHTAAWALARILISVNPLLIFPASGSPPLSSTIRPLVSLLASPNNTPNPFSASTPTNQASSHPSSTGDDPPSLLPTFESLLALTNLASSPPSTSIQGIITKLATPTIEDLLLHSNENIQRASVELACNLCTAPEGLALFIPDLNLDATSSKVTTMNGNGKVDNNETSMAGGAKRRLHILLALTDSPHVATRRAAGGALASITSVEEGVKAVVERERGLELLLGLCGGDGGGCDGNHVSGDTAEEEIHANGVEEVEEDEGCVHRGLVCIGNVISLGGEDAMWRVKKLGAGKILDAVERRFGEGEVGAVAGEVRSLLLEGGGPRVEEMD